MTEAAGLRVLIVEDEAMVAMMIEDIVSELGHEVARTAGRLATALASAKELEVDFAIVDVNLNGEHTYPVAEALTARGVPFVFATGYGAQGLKDPWSRSLVLQKPFHPEDLARAMNAARGR